VNGDTIQNNGYGITLESASTLTVSKGSARGGGTIQNNAYTGVVADGNSTVTLGSGAATISSNGLGGIEIVKGSVLTVGRNNEILGGTGSAVVIGALSVAQFLAGPPPSNVTGSGTVVDCRGRYSVAKGSQDYPEITTNCVP
jgi:hypothetical protein